MGSIVVWAHLAATLYLAGLIWCIQVVHYPLMDRVGADFLHSIETMHDRLAAKSAVAIQLPLGQEDKHEGIIDLVEMKAVRYLAEELGARFEIEEIRLGENSELGGRTLADLQFRQKYEVTVIGIIRGDRRIAALRTTERLLSEDRLVVIGTAEAVRRLKGMEPL